MAGLGVWTHNVAAKMKAKFNNLQTFTQLRKTTTLTEHDATGVQTASDPAGSGFVLHNREVTIDTDTRPETDNMEW